jgi:hypothetical protein
MHPKKFVILATTLLLTAACGLKEEKPDLSSDGKTFEAALRTPGDWQLVQTIESAHPYRDNFERLWQVNGDPNTQEMLVEFTRFELESGYDYVYVNDAGGAQLTENTGNRTGTELVLRGNSVELFFRTDESVTRHGFRANVYQRRSCACITLYKPVCGVDGNTYGNSCQAACAGQPVAFNSACPTGSPWFPVGRTIDSPHNYTDNYDNSWTVGEGGARFVRVHFTRIDVERGYDFVIVKDAAGTVVARYTGASQDVTTPPISGSSATIQLVSDGSIVRYGFSIDRYEVIGGCLDDADCSSGQTCNTNIQCIRAPCFSICEDPTGGYEEVTVAELETNRANWNGRRVRITTEPTVHGAACTRRACSQANPCCNNCSASFVVGNSIALRDANDQPYGCRGNECNWQDTCDPFAAMGAGQYEITGTFWMDTVGQDRILIDNYVAAECRRGGCSGQACSNGGNAITTCEFRPEYACYQTAACEAQADGHCGWTQTPELLMCIDNARTERFPATDLPLAIPDANTTGVTSRLLVPTSGAIGSLRVSVHITHTYRGDLVVRLTAPSGQSFLLHNGEGGSADDLVIVDRELAGAVGLERNGQWSLSVVDRYARDTGTVDSFELSFP